MTVDTTKSVDALKTALESVQAAIDLIEAPKKAAKRTRIAFRPVVVENTRFASITDGARYLAGRKTSYANKKLYNRAVASKIKAITRKCDQDCWDGYYWAE